MTVYNYNYNLKYCCFDMIRCIHINAALTHVLFSVTQTAFNNTIIHDEIGSDLIPL